MTTTTLVKRQNYTTFPFYRYWKKKNNKQNTVLLKSIDRCSEAIRILKTDFFEFQSLISKHLIRTFTQQMYDLYSGFGYRKEFRVSVNEHFLRSRLNVNLIRVFKKITHVVYRSTWYYRRKIDIVIRFYFLSKHSEKNGNFKLIFYH